MSITFQLLSENDLAVLERVEDHVFDHPIQLELAAAYLRDPNNLLAVAILDGVVVGMASGIAYIHPDKPLQLFVNEVGVSERCRSQGLGKKLVSLLLQRGRELGCSEAWVATEENNAAARALYTAAQGKEEPNLAVVYTWSLSNSERCSKDNSV